MDFFDKPWKLDENLEIVFASHGRDIPISILNSYLSRIPMNSDERKNLLASANEAYHAAIHKYGVDAPETNDAHIRFSNILRQETDAAFLANRIQKQTRALTGINCFACYMDVDGFRRRVMTDPAKLFDEYRKQSDHMLRTFFAPSAGLDQGEVKILDDFDRLVWPYMFSDSWFFVTLDDTEQSLRQIITAAAGLLIRGFEMKLPARGGIAQGQIWWHPNDQIILGPAIVHAYETAERMDCFGVAIHDGLAARAPTDAITNTISVPSKPSKDRAIESLDIRFARLSAHETAGRKFNIESYADRFTTMVCEYESSTGAKPQVVARYKRSIEIVQAMMDMGTEKVPEPLIVRKAPGPQRN